MIKLFFNLLTHPLEAMALAFPLNWLLGGTQGVLLFTFLCNNLTYNKDR